jgi:hypothetical protein
LLKIFEQNASNAFKEAERATKESTKHNLGRRRYSNMVNFGLNFILPSTPPKIEYGFEQQGGLAANSEWVLLRFNETTDETALRAVTPFGRKPIPSKGLIWLSLPDFRVLRIDFTFKQEHEFYPIAGRYLSEYTPGPDKLLLPARFEERFFDLKDPGAHALRIGGYLLQLSPLFSRGEDRACRPGGAAMKRFDRETTVDLGKSTCSSLLSMCC